MDTLEKKATACVFAVLGILIALKSCADVDNDLFFHVVEGRRIVAEHRLPLAEEHSITAAGRPMIATEWLAQAAIYAVFRLAGHGGLVAFHTLLVLGALFLLWLAMGSEAPWGARLFLLALTALGMATFYAVRIQYYTFLFFAAFLFWARCWEEGAAWAPWAMAASLLPWVNVHGGFLAGWAMLALVCALDLWRTGRAAALAPLLAGTAACCVHPNGAQALLYPAWFLFRAPPARSMITEWKPVDFSEGPALPWLLALACLAWAGIGGQRGRFPRALLALALLASGLRGRKLMPLFAMAAAFALARRAEDAPASAARDRVLAGAGVLLLGLLGAVVLHTARGVPWPNPAADWERNYPRAPAEMIASRWPGRRLLNSYDWGGYLIYKLHPRTRVFIDGRLEPYWDVLGGDYKSLIEGAPDWRRLLEKHRIELALLKPTVRLAHLLAAEPGWRPVFSDRMAILFVREAPPAENRPAAPPKTRGRSQRVR